MKDMLGILEGVAKQGRPLLIIMEDVDGGNVSNFEVVNRITVALTSSGC